MYTAILFRTNSILTSMTKATWIMNILSNIIFFCLFAIFLWQLYSIFMFQMIKVTVFHKISVIASIKKNISIIYAWSLVKITYFYSSATSRYLHTIDIYYSIIICTSPNKSVITSAAIIIRIMYIWVSIKVTCLFLVQQSLHNSILWGTTKYLL